jgi:Rho termination factor, N-terminal domain
MTSLSDTLTVGLVLVLLFGSIALYLYTRIQQAEQKISLLESILLDMKMGMEFKSYTKLPATESVSVEEGDLDVVPTESYAPFSENENHEETEVSEEVKYPLYGQQQTSLNSVVNKSENENLQTAELEEYKSVLADMKEELGPQSSDVPILPKASPVSVNYESMTLKELQALAKSRGITGAGSMKKGPIIEALKTADKAHSNSESGSLGGLTSTFLETTSTFQAGSLEETSE